MEPLFEEIEVELEIDLAKKFQFPKEIAIKRYENRILLYIQKGCCGLYLMIMN